jgi:hypothetical protein
MNFLRSNENGNLINKILIYAVTADLLGKGNVLPHPTHEQPTGAGPQVNIDGYCASVCLPLNDGHYLHIEVKGPMYYGIFPKRKIRIGAFYSDNAQKEGNVRSGLVGLCEARSEAIVHAVKGSMPYLGL